MEGLDGSLSCVKIVGESRVFEDREGVRFRHQNIMKIARMTNYKTSLKIEQKCFLDVK